MLRFAISSPCLVVSSSFSSYLSTLRSPRSPSSTLFSSGIALPPPPRASLRFAFGAARSGDLGRLGDRRKLPRGFRAPLTRVRRSTKRTRYTFPTIFPNIVTARFHFLILCRLIGLFCDRGLFVAAGQCSLATTYAAFRLPRASVYLRIDLLLYTDILVVTLLVITNYSVHTSYILWGLAVRMYRSHACIPTRCAVYAILFHSVCDYFCVSVFPRVSMCCFLPAENLQSFADWTAIE